MYKISSSSNDSLLPPTHTSIRRVTRAAQRRMIHTRNLAISRHSSVKKRAAVSLAYVQQERKKERERAPHATRNSRRELRAIKRSLGRGFALQIRWKLGTRKPVCALYMRDTQSIRPYIVEECIACCRRCSIPLSQMNPAGHTFVIIRVRGGGCSIHIHAHVLERARDG